MPLNRLGRRIDSDRVSKRGVALRASPFTGMAGGDRPATGRMTMVIADGGVGVQRHVSGARTAHSSFCSIRMAPLLRRDVHRRERQRHEARGAIVARVITRANLEASSRHCQLPPPRHSQQGCQTARTGLKDPVRSERTCLNWSSASALGSGRRAPRSSTNISQAGP